MKQLNRTVNILMMLAVVACNNKNVEDHPIKMIDIEANIKNLQLVNLSQFTNDIQYVPIESGTLNPVNVYPGFIVSNNQILTSDSEGSFLLFDLLGKFIRKFGYTGRGPDEYQSIENLIVDGKNKIFFSSLYDLFEFNSEGVLEKKYPKSLLIDEKFLLKNWCILEDSLIFGHIENDDGQTKIKAMLIAKYGKVKQSYTNYDLLENKGSRIIGGSTQIFHFERNVYFKEQFTDTLFFLNKSHQLTPCYAFNMGSLKMPVSVRCNFHEYFQKMYDYIALENIFQTEEYLFLKVNFGNSFPAKRLTPGTSVIPGGNPTLTNTTYCLGIYSKVNDELVFCKPTSTDNPLFTSGICNDIDGGPRFFPQKMVNDSTMLMVVSAKEFKDHIASDDFKNSNPKYPEKKQQLEELANNLSEFDNPVLVFVTF